MQADDFSNFKRRGRNNKQDCSHKTAWVNAGWDSPNPGAILEPEELPSSDSDQDKAGKHRILPVQ